MTAGNIATSAGQRVLAGYGELEGDLHALYRHLHANPELSMHEHATAALVEQRLTALGAETFRCGGTGVVGVLRNGTGPTVAFRADTDALPVAERTGLDYASAATATRDDGTSTPVMHACGHDTHTATALAAAALLSGARDSWAGTVVFVFQPGEEVGAGAQAMVDDGLWDRAPRPEVVLGQHVSPEPAGRISYRAGVAASMADSWKVTMYGRGAHGSQPHRGIDPIVQVAHAITRIQTVTSREVDPVESAVVTVGQVAGGLKENIIPDSAMFTLNVRTFDDQVRQRALGALRRIVSAEAAASGAPEPEITELSRFPKLVNDAGVTERAAEALAGHFADGQVREGGRLMGSEDFGVLGGAIGVPSCFWFIGGTAPDAYHAAEERGSLEEDVPSNHSPFFAPAPEPTLPSMVQAAVLSTLAFLRT
ncbi:amidohydrolase [Salinifilum ghardaiensis]